MKLEVESVGSRTREVEERLQQVVQCMNGLQIQGQMHQETMIQSFLRFRPMIEEVPPTTPMHNERPQFGSVQPTHEEIAASQANMFGRYGLPACSRDARSLPPSAITLSTDAPTSTIQIRSLAQVSCKAVPCQCSCHKQTRRQTPRFLEQIIGIILLGYGSLHCAGSECNVGGCRRRPPVYTVTYAPPQWALRYRLFWTTSKRPYGHPERPLRVFMLRPNSSVIFVAAAYGDLQSLQKVLKDGRGSVLDVNEAGVSALKVSQPLRDIIGYSQIVSSTL